LAQGSSPRLAELKICLCSSPRLAEFKKSLPYTMESPKFELGCLQQPFPSDIMWGEGPLSGDFYQEDDTVCRGVTLAEPSAWEGLYTHLEDAHDSVCSFDTSVGAHMAPAVEPFVTKDVRLLEQLHQQQQLLHSLQQEAAKAQSKEHAALELLAQAETHARSEAASAEAAIANASAMEMRFSAEVSELREQMLRGRDSLATSESKRLEAEAHLDEAIMRASDLEAKMVAANEVPTRLRFLYASPLLIGGSALPELRIEDEISEIRRALSGAVPMEVEVATVSSLRQAVGERGLWLHISMHCVKDQRNNGALAFEASRGARAYILFEGQLEQLLREGDGVRVDFVFLSACESRRLAPIFRAAGVKHVVCCSTQVKDIDAQQFARSLYFELANRTSLQDAFAIAARTGKCNGYEGEYCLMTDGSPWPDNLLMLGRRSNLDPLVHGQPLQGLPRQVEDFVGRLEVIDRVLAAFAVRRVVVVHCESPFGRTATLKEIVRYASLPGRAFAGRVAFFPRRVAGGMLVVDDGDALLAGEGQLQLRRHLELEGAVLLVACRLPVSDPFDGIDKAINIPLMPLRPGEAAELFLRRVSRPLLAVDLCAAVELQCRKEDPSRVLPREEAWQHLQRLLGEIPWGGEPGRIRRAAASVCAGCAALEGSLLGLCPQLGDVVSGH